MTEQSVVIDAASLWSGAKKAARFLAFWGGLLLLAALAYWMALLAADPQQDHRFIYGGVGAAATILVLVLQEVRRSRSERGAEKRVVRAEAEAADAEVKRAKAVEAEADFRALAVDLTARFNSSIGDVISPLAHELAALIACPAQEVGAARGAVLQQVVDAAVTLCGGTGVRAAIYELGKTATGKPSDLVRCKWGGGKTPRADPSHARTVTLESERSRT